MNNKKIKFKIYSLWLQFLGFSFLGVTLYIIIVDLHSFMKNESVTLPRNFVEICFVFIGLSVLTYKAFTTSVIVDFLEDELILDNGLKIMMTSIIGITETSHEITSKWGSTRIFRVVFRVETKNAKYYKLEYKTIDFWSKRNKDKFIKAIIEHNKMKLIENECDSDENDTRKYQVYKKNGKRKKRQHVF